MSSSGPTVKVEGAPPSRGPLVFLSRRTGGDVFANGVKDAYLRRLFFDIKLICADGSNFYAHSLVLSLFSDFFAERANRNENTFKEIDLGGVNSEHVNLLLRLIYVGNVAVPMSCYSDLIETAKSLKLDKFVHHDLSLNCFDSGTILEYKDGGVGSDTATGSSSEDSVDGKLVIDEPGDDQVGSRGASSYAAAAAAATTVTTVSPFCHTLLIEDVPVGNVTRRPRIVFDSERQIMKVEETGDDDEGDDGICPLRPGAAAGRFERPPTLLMPPLPPPPFPPPPSARLSPATAPASTKPFLKCDSCKRRFTKPYYLFVHKQLHEESPACAVKEEGEGSDMCPVCHKGFQSRHAVMSHMKIHSGYGGVKPHHCETCNKTFAGRAYFRLHRKLHSGEKPHECPVCGKRFALRIYLTSHKKIHERQRSEAANSLSGKRRMRTTSVASTVW